MMKKLISLVLLMFIVAVGAQAQKTYALLVGVSNYKSGSQPSLNYPAKDAKDMKKVFKKQGFDCGVVTSSKATTANVIARLKKLAAIAGPDDKIIFFFSGHGGPLVTCLYDGLLPYEYIASILSTSRSQHIIVMIDACMSGSADAVFRENPDYGRITFLTGSSAVQTSSDGIVIDNGYMSKALIAGMRGLADQNKDNKVTLLELFNFCHTDVVNRSSGEQTPHLIGPSSEHQTVITRW